MLTYGLSAGVRMEYLYNSTFDDSFSGFSISYGLLYKFYRIPFLRHLSTGLVIENLPASIKWSTGTKDDVTSRLKWGLAYKLFHDHLVLSGHLVYEKDIPLGWAIGTEYSYKNIFFRIGGEPYFYNTGVGFRYQVYEINYSLNIDDLGYNHYVALNYKFGGRIEEETRSRIMGEIINTRSEDYYSEGMFNYDQGRYNDALKNFKLALLWNPEMDKAEEKVKELEKDIKTGKIKPEGLKPVKFKTTCPPAKELLQHYYAGINAYMNNDLETALKEWRFVAQCDPDNEKVKMNIKKAEIKLKEMQK